MVLSNDELSWGRKVEKYIIIHQFSFPIFIVVDNLVLMIHAIV